MDCIKTMMMNMTMSMMMKMKRMKTKYIKKTFSINKMLLG